MNDKDYILPLGTVVRTEHGEMKLIIVGRAQLFDNEGTTGYFDYSALAYPQGVTGNERFAFFNHEDISEIFFEGYRDEQEIDFANRYDEALKSSPYPKLTLEFDD